MEIQRPASPRVLIIEQLAVRIENIRHICAEEEVICQRQGLGERDEYRRRGRDRCPSSIDTRCPPGIDGQVGKSWGQTSRPGLHLKDHGGARDFGVRDPYQSRTELTRFFPHQGGLYTCRRVFQVLPIIGQTPGGQGAGTQTENPTLVRAFSHPLSGTVGWHEQREAPITDLLRLGAWGVDSDYCPPRSDVTEFPFIHQRRGRYVSGLYRRRDAHGSCHESSRKTYGREGDAHLLDDSSNPSGPT